MQKKNGDTLRIPGFLDPKSLAVSYKVMRSDRTNVFKAVIQNIPLKS